MSKELQLNISGYLELLDNLQFLAEAILIEIGEGSCIVQRDEQIIKFENVDGSLRISDVNITKLPPRKNIIDNIKKFR